MYVNIQETFPSRHRIPDRSDPFGFGVRISAKEAIEEYKIDLKYARIEIDELKERLYILEQRNEELKRASDLAKFVINSHQDSECIKMYNENNDLVQKYAELNEKYESMCNKYDKYMKTIYDIAEQLKTLDKQE